MINRLALAGLGFLIAGPAFGADLPVKAPPMAPVPMMTGYNWSGFYVGGHGGYGWGRTDSTAVTPSGSFPAGFAFTTLEPHGGIAGGQVGFNYQIGNFVLGAEGQFSWADLKDTQRSNSPLIAGRFVDTTGSVDWISTATGRVGYAWDSWMLYGKGGAAWARYKSDSTTFTGAGATVATTTGEATRFGWVVGGGLEYGFWNNWSVAIEYNYLDFGTATETRFSVNAPAFGGASTNLDRDVDSRIHTVKGSLNYRFNWGGGGPVMARY